ncbi:pre-mRNA-processing factor 39-like isoform X4 [Asterias rubens]|uniref:pre-mRNA-processing factor 39-like isoform X4 n=1 Tax=Asterias rubens TaxID=7604 RepID=UPI0014551345|nr:pre-mRNA-processing factor 39-like isoform X4 [Asterias rubens]
MESPEEISENGATEPSQTETPVISSDYDPSIPTDEKDVSDGITPSKMKVAELRSELTVRGLDSKGVKAALVQRLEEAISAGPGGEAIVGAEDGDAEEKEDDAIVLEEVKEDEVMEIKDAEDSDDTITEDQKQQEDEPMEQEATKPQESTEDKMEEPETEQPKADQKPAEEAAQPAEDAGTTQKDPVKPKEKATDAKTQLKTKKADATSTKEATEVKKVVEVKPVVDATKPAAEPVKKSEKMTKEEKAKADAEKAPPPELEKYWKAVKDKPTDFTGWTYLLQYVEQQVHMPSVRKAFDAFLARYPYCYGYWKKYADMERRKANDIEKAQEVFESGMKAIPLSVDLWLQYIQFIAQTAPKDSITDRLREVYARAIAAAGTDFRSDKLWDMYISFEKDRKEWYKVTKIYDQLLTIPTQLYSHHFEKFKEHVNNKGRHPKDILSVDEFIKLRMEVVDELGVAEPGTESFGDDGDVGPPGDEEAPPGVDVGVPGMDPLMSVKPGASSKVKVSAQVDEENEAIRKKVIESRLTIYRLTEQEVSKRWAYEEGIRRPYFHAKPLEKSQLKNWREYLDFETTNGTHERVLILYERCLVACALYEEFWMKYAKYLEPHSIEGVSSVYRRACNIHLPRKPSIHLRWAAFEEKQGNMNIAKEVLKKLEENLPELIMVTLERVSLERRVNNKEGVVDILKNRITAHNQQQIKFFLSSKLSRYYAKVLNDVMSARKVLYEVLEEAKDKSRVYLQLLDLEIQQIPNNEPIILDLFQKGEQSSTSVDNKMKFSQRRLTYLMDFGTDVSKLQTAYEEHQELLKGQLEILQAASKKRTAEATTPTQPEKKAKKETTTTAAAATPSTTPAKTPAVTSTPPQGQMPPAQPYNGPADYSQSPQQAGQNAAAWGNYNQGAPYGPQGPPPSYGPPPGPGGYNAPPNNNYNQQYQQYQQAWGNFNQGYYPR